jgi:hypothetical protein
MDTRAALLVALAACASPPAPTTVRTYELADLPVTEWTAGLPARGDGRLEVGLTAIAPADWRTVTGTVDFRCDGCTLGDDVAELQVAAPMDLGTGIYFGHLTFDTVRAHADFAGGSVRVTAQLRSPDLVLDADVRGTLAQRAADTVLDGCVRLRLTDALARRDPKLHAVFTMTGAPQASDGTYVIAIGGTLDAPKYLPRACTIPL